MTLDHGVLTRDMETLEATMTPASHTEAMTEVNNNETLTQKQQVKEAEAGDQLSPSPSDPETEASSQSPETSRTITVTDPEEWLCVARRPASTDDGRRTCFYVFFGVATGRRSNGVAGF